MKGWQREVCSSSEVAKLGPRSRRVLLLKLEKLVDKEIAARVHLSLTGVRYHVRRIHAVLVHLC